MPILMYKGVNLSGSGMSASSSLDDASENSVATTKLTNELNITKAPLESPVFTGTPEVPTAEGGSNSNQIANTEFVKAQIDNLTKAINDATALRASLEAYGMTKITDSSAVTDSTGLALAATEKNASIDGTLANQISQLNSDINKSIRQLTNSKYFITDCNEAKTYGVYFTNTMYNTKNLPRELKDIMNGRCVLSVYGESSYLYQILTYQNNMFYRTFDFSNNTFFEWQKMTGRMFFTSVTELGLGVTTCTLDDIANALPEHSEIHLSVGSSIYYGVPDTYGSLVVTKDDARVTATYRTVLEADKYKIYYNNYNSSFLGWYYVEGAPV